MTRGTGLGADGAAAPAHDELPSWQQRYEDELEKIRTEGDLALIKAHAERQSILAADKELEALKKQLKDAKKHFNALSKSAAGAHHGGLVHAATVVAATGAASSAQAAPMQSSAGDHSSAITVAALAAPTDTMSAQRLMQIEERLRVAVSERQIELQKLRQQIDQARRQRIEGLQNEKRISDVTRQTDDETQQTQREVEMLKERAAQLKREITQLQSNFDVDKQALRIEKQRLSLEVARIAKPDKVGVKVALPTRKSIYNSIGSRNKHAHMSRAKKMSLEQKVVSFEQKKLLLDKLVEDTGIANLGAFIERYNEQERVKAEILARIEAKSNTNAALTEAIALLAEDITRLSGVGDIQAIVHMEQPSDLKRLIDADEQQTNQWSHDAQVYAETLKLFREPIRELYLELFPRDRGDEASDSTINELSMLRRIGAIEERVMQRVLLKILHEMDTTQSSETWTRLRKYQGLSKDTAASSGNSTRDSGGESESEHVRASELAVDPPSVRDAIVADFDEDSDDPHSEVPLTAIHSDDVRQQQSNINKSSSSSTGSSGSAAGSLSGTGAAATATQAHRKLAAISL